MYSSEASTVSKGPLSIMAKAIKPKCVIEGISQTRWNFLAIS
jgi:hypothetical protein